MNFTINLKVNNLKIKKAIKILKYLTRGNSKQIKYLISDEINIVKIFCYTTTFFKESDSLISDIYKINDNFYNFDIVK
jgi:hypothetical protein